MVSKWFASVMYAARRKVINNIADAFAVCVIYKYFFQYGSFFFVIVSVAVQLIS